MDVSSLFLLQHFFRLRWRLVLQSLRRLFLHFFYQNSFVVLNITELLFHNLIKIHNSLYVFTSFESTCFSIVKVLCMVLYH